MPAQTVQHTIRGIPESVDKALRSKSKEAGSSLNQMAIEALARGLGVADEPAIHHDLDDLAGTWKEDPAIDKAIADQDKVDDELWK